MLNHLTQQQQQQQQLQTQQQLAEVMASPPLPPAAEPVDLDACINQIMPGVQEAILQVQPPETVLDRIYFVINNVSVNNLDSKAKELKDVLKEEHYPWLANYLVQKRISPHGNLQAMYLTFIDKLKAPSLTKWVLLHVLQYVSKLLRSHKIISSTGDRSVLKNLGSFLGQMTVARNRPLLQRHMDLKELLYHGYETGRLFALTPFVSKIMECTRGSKVFRPPNPWLMGLMGVLAELYQVDDLKINIKFEIDLLCKSLDLKIADVPLSNTLQGRLQPKKEKNPDFNVKVGLTSTPMMSPQQGGMAGPELGAPGVGGGGGLGGSLETETSIGRGTDGGEGTFAEETVIPNLAAYVVVNPQVALFTQSPHLRRLVPLAVDRAIREIIQPVVERSVTIACITSKELIVKDFAMEPDEKKMGKAAHLMVSSLAGSLALVTCKEPLRVSMGNQLRTLFTQAGVEAGSTDQVIQVCVAENLELGCILIEKAATEKAMRDIDEALAVALGHRKKHREQTGSPFYDMSIFSNSRFPGALPDMLRPKPGVGGLSPAQLDVYEAFQRALTARGTVAATGVSGNAAVGGGTNTGAGTLVPPLRPMNSPVMTGAMTVGEKKGLEGELGGAVGVGSVSLPQALEALDALVLRLNQALQNLVLAAAGRDITFSMLGAEHEVPCAMRELVHLPQNLPSPAREDVALRASQAVFKMLYDNSASVGGGAASPSGGLSSLTSGEIVRLEALVTVLEGLQVKKADLLSWIGYVPVSELNRQSHKTALLLLLRSDLLKTSDMDSYLAKSMDQGRNALWVDIATQIARFIVMERVAAYQELAQTLDCLQKSAPRQPINARKEIQRLVDDIRLLVSQDAAEAQQKQLAAAQQQQPPQLQTSPVLQSQQASQQAAAAAAAAAVMKGGLQAQQQLVGGVNIGARAAGNLSPAARQDRQDVTILLEHWIVLWNESPGSEKAYLKYFTLLQQYEVTKSPDQIEKFIRIATDVCVEACLKNAVVSEQVAEGVADGGGGVQRTTLSYTIVDAYAKLLFLLVKYNGDVNSRINILQRILKALVSSLRDQSQAQQGGNQAAPSGSADFRPYFRLLVDLLHDFNAFDSALDTNNIQVLTAFAIACNNLQPALVPGFAFAWLELISHRMFMPALLLAKGQKGWILMHRLLMDLFSFLEPFLRKAELTDPIRILYKGTLRVLLVLLHDFPEFLCDYHVSFCDVIPPSCIQLRNLILSAFPRNMRLPDPFTPNLKVDLLPEITQPPRIPAGYTGALLSLKHEVDAYLKTRAQPTYFLAELPKKLKANTGDGQAYNTPAMNALVIYVGTMAITQIQNTTAAGGGAGAVGTGAGAGAGATTSMAITAHSAPMDIFQGLINGLDPEGRYLFLNAIANQLRYPNSQTHYFSCVLLYLFAEASSDVIKEQITRVLLERLIVHRPHPWGLLITFIELIKNPRYTFWQHSFTRCAPEIERVFESVARSCMGQPQAQQQGGAAAGGIGGEEGGPVVVSGP